MIHFKDRKEAGERLAALLEQYKGASDAMVVGLARGGVATAAEVARTLNLPLDAMVVRKIGAPDQEELAIGAIGEDGSIVRNDEIIKMIGISEKDFKKLVKKKQKEVDERVELYRSHYPKLDMKEKVVILVDDGIATGATMEVAVKTAFAGKAREVVVAVPVLPSDTVKKLKKISSRVVFLEAPDLFGAIGSFYSDFTQVEHDEVISLLKGQ